jgi:hypothetical protein
LPEAESFTVPDERTLSRAAALSNQDDVTLQRFAAHRSPSVLVFVGH